MSFRFKTFTLGAALATALAAPSWSQELAREVVQEQLDQIARTGATVTVGPKVESGSTVEWKDIVIGLPEEMGTYTIAFIKAEEIGGGQVRMSYPDKLNWTIDPKGEQPKMDIAMATKGFSHIVSGAKGARSHAYAAETFDVTVKAAGDLGLDLTITLSDLIGGQKDSMIGTGDTAFQNYKGDIKAATMVLAYAFSQDDVAATTKATYNNLTATYDIDEVDQTNLETMFQGERNARASFKVDSASGVSDVTQPEMSMTMDIKSGLNEGVYAIEDGVLSLSGVGKDMVYDVRLKELPLPPFQISMDTVDVSFAMPMAKSDAAKDARIKVGFDGLKMSDTIWGMFDPTGALPRDKARINLDLSAKMKWLVDLMKLEEMDNADMPAMVDSVSLNDMTLEIAGAKLNGVGSAVLDNSSMPPLPVGELNLDLKGGIGLLDKLVSLGLMPAEQGQMVKMMSGMFTVPGGEGDDHLTSKIEMKEGGAILANGQRIQ